MKVNLRDLITNKEINIGTGEARRIIVCKIEVRTKFALSLSGMENVMYLKILIAN